MTSEREKALEPVAWTIIFNGWYGVNPETTYKTKEQADLYVKSCGRGTVVPLYIHPSPSISDEMVERAAVAIDKAMGSSGKTWYQQTRYARAALEAALSVAPKGDGWHPIDIDFLRETLAWVRRNFAGGSTKQVREQIDLALEHLIAAAPTKDH